MTPGIEFRPIKWQVLEEFYPHYGHIAGGITIDEVKQRDGGVRYAVRMRSFFDLNRDGNWDYAPMPSDRDDEYLETHRWDTLDEAQRVAQLVAGDILTKLRHSPSPTGAEGGD